MNFFEGDDDKVNLWMITPNPLLGDVSPTEMIYFGRVEKLLEFMKCQLEGDVP